MIYLSVHSCYKISHLTLFVSCLNIRCDTNKEQTRRYTIFSHLIYTYTLYTHITFFLLCRFSIEVLHESPYTNTTQHTKHYHLNTHTFLRIDLVSEFYMNLPPAAARLRASRIATQGGFTGGPPPGTVLYM